MRWLDTAKVNEFGEVQLKLHNELAPHLLGLKREYTQFNFLNVVNMTSKYEVALYEFLHSYYNMTGVPDIPVEEMRSLFGMDDEEKYPWFRVQDKIKKAISGIERKTTMLITMETIKRGRKVVKLRFFLTSQETQQMLEVKQNGND
jgi:plasmid replication initiation protein